MGDRAGGCPYHACPSVESGRSCVSGVGLYVPVHASPSVPSHLYHSTRCWPKPDKQDMTTGICALPESQSDRNQSWPQLKPCPSACGAPVVCHLGSRKLRRSEVDLPGSVQHDSGDSHPSSTALFLLWAREHSGWHHQAKTLFDFQSRVF